MLFLRRNPAIVAFSKVSSAAYVTKKQNNPHQQQCPLIGGRKYDHFISKLSLSLHLFLPLALSCDVDYLTRGQHD